MPEVFLEHKSHTWPRRAPETELSAGRTVTKSRKLADRMFMTRHPDALIEHVDGDEDN
jgi:hypothetical protein